MVHAWWCIPAGGPGRLRLSVLRSRCRRGRSLNEKVKHERIEFKRKRTRICLKLRLLAWKRRVSRQLATKSGLPRQRAWDRAKPRDAHGAVNGAMGNFSEPKRTAPLELAMPDVGEMSHPIDGRRDARCGPHERRQTVAARNGRLLNYTIARLLCA